MNVTTFRGAQQASITKQDGVRYGQGRSHTPLDRDGRGVNGKNVDLIDMGPRHRRTETQARRTGCSAGKRCPRRVEGKLQEVVGPHDVWAMGVVHGRQATGRKLRVLLSPPSRGACPCPTCATATEGRTSRHADRLCRSAAEPGTIRMDQGCKYVARHMEDRLYRRGVALCFSRRC